LNFKLAANNFEAKFNASASVENKNNNKLVKIKQQNFLAVLE